MAVVAVVAVAALPVHEAELPVTLIPHDPLAPVPVVGTNAPADPTAITRAVVTLVPGVTPAHVFRFVLWACTVLPIADATSAVPTTPAAGKPVQLVSVPLDGVPNAPPLVTKDPAVPMFTPSAVDTPVPNPVTDPRGNAVQLDRLPLDGVPRAPPL